MNGLKNLRNIQRNNKLKFKLARNSCQNVQKDVQTIQKLQKIPDQKQPNSSKKSLRSSSDADSPHLNPLYSQSVPSHPDKIEHRISRSYKEFRDKQNTEKPPGRKFFKALIDPGQV